MSDRNFHTAYTFHGSIDLKVDNSSKFTAKDCLNLMTRGFDLGVYKEVMIVPITDLHSELDSSLHEIRDKYVVLVR